MTLAVELTNDPAGKGYAALWPDSPGSIAEILNAPGTDTHIASRMISARTIMAELGASAFSVLDKLTNAAQVSTAVKWAMVFLSQDTGLDVGSTACQYMIRQLVAGGVLAEAEGAALANMAMAPCSRAEKIGVPHVTIEQIIKAMT